MCAEAFTFLYFVPAVCNTEFEASKIIDFAGIYLTQSSTLKFSSLICSLFTVKHTFSALMKMINDR